MTDPTATEQTPPPTRRQRQAAQIAEAASGRIGWMLLKIVLLAVVDAIALYAVFVLFTNREWVVLGLVVLVTAFVNYVYFSRKAIPAKYLTPGVIFLIIFQVFTLLYTGYIGFTNYGTGHNGSKDQAVAALMASAQERVEDSPAYPVTVVRAARHPRAARHGSGGRRRQRRFERPAAHGSRRRDDGGRQGGRRRRVGRAQLRPGSHPVQRDRAAVGRLQQ